MREALALAVLLVLVAAGPGSAQGPGQPQHQPLPAPAPPPPPPQPSDPLDAPPARGCQTQWGVCPLACCVQPGTPCYCLTPDNVQVPGYAVQYYRP